MAKASLPKSAPLVILQDNRPTTKQPLVLVRKGDTKPTTDTERLSVAMGMRHNNLLRAVERNRESLERYGDLVHTTTTSDPSKPGRKVVPIVLNEQHFLLLFMQFRTDKSPKVREVHHAIVAEFGRMRRELERVAPQATKEEPRVSTAVLARVLDRRHSFIMNQVRRCWSTLESYAPVVFTQERHINVRVGRVGTKRVTTAQLTEKQAAYLIMQMRSLNDAVACAQRAIIDGIAGCALIDMLLAADAEPRDQDTEKPATLYYVAIACHGETFYKVGVTSHPLNTRFTPADFSRMTVLLEIPFARKRTAYRCEYGIKEECASAVYTGVDPVFVDFRYKTEVFATDVIETVKRHVAKVAEAA